MPNTPAPEPPIRLSAREREVIELLAVGQQDRIVAERLGISLGTVRVYRKRIEGKLGVRGLVRCLLLLSRAGEVDLDRLTDEVIAQRDLARGR